MGQRNIWLQLRDEAEAVDAAWLRGFLFGQLARVWPEAGERVFWADGLRAAAEVEDEGDRTLLLIHFAPFLPAGLLERACSLVDEVVEPAHRASLLVAFLPFVPAEHQAVMAEAALDEVLSDPLKEGTADKLAALVPFLAEEQLMVAVDRIWKLPEPGLVGAARLLHELLPLLPALERNTVVGQILFQARRLEMDERLGMMAEVAAYLPGVKLQELLDGAGQIGEDELKAGVLERLFAVTQVGWYDRLWDGVRLVWDLNVRCRLICRIYAHLPLSRQAAALSEIRKTLVVSREPEKLLMAVRDHLPPVLLAEVLPVVADLPQEARLAVLDGLLARLPDSLLPEVLEMGLGIGRPELRFRRLEMLDRLAGRLVEWDWLEPGMPRELWQGLFARRKGGNGQNGGAVAHSGEGESAVSRAELLVDLIGLLPFFLHFVPDNYRPKVAVQVVGEMRRLVTGPRIFMYARMKRRNDKS
jgi:hypothetical protein